MDGLWVERRQWNTLAVKVLSLIASVMLVSVIQNMFIAFMRNIIKFEENNQLAKNLNTKIIEIDSEVVTLKGLLKDLISELKDAKGNNSGGKDGDMDDENKKK
nr:15440_t:CDS:2 [Entrophospora candida]